MFFKDPERGTRVLSGAHGTRSHRPTQGINSKLTRAFRELEEYCHYMYWHIFLKLDHREIQS